MSWDGSVTLSWADGEHRFRLPYGQLRELEEKRKSGTYEIFDRIYQGTWSVDDLREVIRLGLIGGGIDQPEPMTAHAALALVDRYFSAWPLLESRIVALATLDAVLSRPAGEPVGKEQAVEPTPASTSAASTKPAARSASRRR